MTDDPNKKQNDSSQSGGRSEQQPERQSGQQHGTAHDSSQKRPSQGGTDAEQGSGKAGSGRATAGFIKDRKLTAPVDCTGAGLIAFHLDFWSKLWQVPRVLRNTRFIQC